MPLLHLESDRLLGARAKSRRTDRLRNFGIVYQYRTYRYYLEAVLRSQAIFSSAPAPDFFFFLLRLQKTDFDT